MEYIDQYIQEVYLFDVWNEIERGHNLGEVCIFSEHLKFSELEKTKYYKEWLKPQNIKDGIAIQLFKTEDYRIVLNVLFSDDKDGLNKLLADLKIYIPHLSQAVEIWMTSVGARETSPFQIKQHFLKETCGLTDREIAIAHAYMYIDNRNRIAEKFNISPETVKSSLYNVRQKLGGVSAEDMKRMLGSFASVGEIDTDFEKKAE